MKKFRLSELKKGQTGKIVSIENSELEFGLLTMGLLPGDEFVLSDMAPMGGPIALSINGGKIALRKNEASLIWVELL